MLEESRAGVRLLSSDVAPDLPEVTGTAGELQAAVVLERPPVAGQYDSTIAVTSVSLFDACPRKYYLSRYLRLAGEHPGFVLDDDLEWETQEGVDASEFGLQVHALLSGQEVEAAAPEARELAARFPKSALGKEVAGARRVEREFDFLIALDDVVLRGQIDLWYEGREGVVIVDYKTDQVKGPVDPERAASYRLQLQIYALALQEFTGAPVARAYLYFLRSDQVIEVDLSPLQLEAARETVRRLRWAQNAVEFPLTEGEHCRRCEYYRGACPAGKGRLAVRTSAALPFSSAARP
ncbi:MAG TPA: PD-(D/E)XK nuclease family protein, partial [Bryobacteraceae bacterium]|nr:PD-(D/E)XK nuclease family protein [Bryobacteraceae bacterium]